MKSQAIKVECFDKEKPFGFVFSQNLEIVHHFEIFNARNSQILIRNNAPKIVIPKRFILDFDQNVNFRIN